MSDSFNIFNEYEFSEKEIKKNPFLKNYKKQINQDNLNTIFGFLDLKSYFNLKHTNRFFYNEIQHNPEKIKRPEIFFVEIVFHRGIDSKEEEEEKFSDYKEYFPNITYDWYDSSPHHLWNEWILVFKYFSHESIYEFQKYIFDRFLKYDSRENQGLEIKFRPFGEKLDHPEYYYNIPNED